MRGAKFYIKIAAAVLAVCLLAGGIAYLKWDYDKSRSELIEINKDFLQAQLNRLPLPKEKTESEDMVKQGGFKGIVAYYIGPVDQAEAEGMIRYYQDREESLLGIYTPLEGALTGVFVGEHRYTPVIEALGYGWLSYEGNLYADYHRDYTTSYLGGRQEAEGKPNYRNQYTFNFVRDNAKYNIVVFCNQSDPQKALSAVVDYISSLLA